MPPAHHLRFDSSAPGDSPSQSRLVLERPAPRLVSAEEALLIETTSAPRSVELVAAKQQPTKPLPNPAPTQSKKMKRLHAGRSGFRSSAARRRAAAGETRHKRWP